MPPAERSPSLRRAVALGLLQGPSELLPISSSAHTALIPWLVGRDGIEPSEPRSRALEVALHGGACLALTLEMAGPLWRELAPTGRRGVLSMALAVAPPALAGVAARGIIERRLSGPLASAAGLAAGGVAMAGADLWEHSRERSAAQLGPSDGFALGLAQALALAPGVSRNGATLTLARARGFSRPAAQRLSWTAGLAIMAGAAGAETVRAARGGTQGGRPALAAGAVAAFLSTRISARLLAARVERGPLWPYSLYRLGLASLILRRARRAQ